MVRTRNFPILVAIALLAILSLAMPASAQTLSEKSTSEKQSRHPLDSSSISFQPVVTYDSGGSEASSVTLADVNHDGKLDIVVSNNWNCNSGNCATNGTVGILLGNGDGTFKPTVSYNSGGQFAIAVAVADVNGDGKLDVIVANQCPLGGCVAPIEGVVSVLLGNGDGTFRTAVPYTLTGQADALVVTDVNGDAKPDLVVAIAGAQADVLLGNGDGTFQTAVVNSEFGSALSTLAVADITGDGKPDLLLSSDYGSCNNNGCGPGEIGIFDGEGNGLFQPPQTEYAAGGNEPDAIALADVNGDGKADLVVGNRCNTWSGGLCSGPGSVGLLLGNGDGTFQTAVSYNSTTLVYPAVAVADMNGDGKADLVALGCVNSSPANSPSYCGSQTDGSLQIMAGNNDGTFQPAVFFDAGGISPSSVAIGDVNGDGKPDAVVAILAAKTGTDGAVGVLLSGTSNTKSMTTTTLTGPTASNPGQQVQFTATVTTQSGDVPTGTVAFNIDGGVVATVTLQNNQAGINHTFTIDQLGGNGVSASYSGDSDNNPSANGFTVDVQIGSICELHSSASPTFVGQPVTFTASVYNRQRGSSPPDGELMNFYDAKTFLASVPLAKGVSVFTTSSLPAGHDSIRVTYDGDADYRSSTRSIVQVINKYATTTSLTSSPNPSAPGQAVTFTATVTPLGPNQPTGKVKFSDGTAGIGIGTLSGGVATLSRSKLASGSHSITAEYEGDATSADSTSVAVVQVVNPE